LRRREIFLYILIRRSNNSEWRLLIWGNQRWLIFLILITYLLRRIECFSSWGRSLGWREYLRILNFTI
jgi:hypothetical protein